MNPKGRTWWSWRSHTKFPIPPPQSLWSRAASTFLLGHSWKTVRKGRKWRLATSAEALTTERMEIQRGWRSGKKCTYKHLIIIVAQYFVVFLSSPAVRGWATQLSVTGTGQMPKSISRAAFQSSGIRSHLEFLKPKVAQVLSSSWWTFSRSLHNFWTFMKHEHFPIFWRFYVVLLWTHS